MLSHADRENFENEKRCDVVKKNEETHSVLTLLSDRGLSFPDSSSCGGGFKLTGGRWELSVLSVGDFKDCWGEVSAWETDIRGDGAAEKN